MASGKSTPCCAVSCSTSVTRTYDAYGLLVSSTGSSASPFGFVGSQGYQEDSDTGLKLLGHRYYDASTGRFLTRDHVKDGRNWYGYCGNNPISRIDPSGEAYWIFDGKFFYLISDDGVTKKVIKKIPAASGKPGATPGDIGSPWTGPLPPGEYYVDPGEIGHNRTINWPGPDFSENSDAWGNARVPLHPKPGTDTKGRSGFFIHGGKDIGSAGCIDVGPQDENVMDLIEKYSNGKPMTVIVGYLPGVVVPGTLSSPVPWKGGARR